MSPRIGLTVSIVIIGGLLSLSRAGESRIEPLTLQIKVYDQNDKQKTLVNVAIQTSDTGDINSFNGGNSIPDPNEKTLEWGTRIEGTLKPTGQEEYRLNLIIQEGGKVHSKDPSTSVVRSEVFEIRTNLQTGKTKRVHCGGTVWCDLHID